MAIHRYVLLVAATCLLFSCASTGPDYEQPTVVLDSFRALPTEGMTPSFEVGLRVLNPNREALNIEGIVYTISIENHELIKGVGKDFPVIEGYSEGVVQLTATAKLWSAIRLLADLANQPGDEMEYRFEAKLDPGGFRPSIRISESGVFSLGSGPVVREKI